MSGYGGGRLTLDNFKLEDGQKYTWEVLDLRDPGNVDAAVFQTPTALQRTQLEISIQNTKSKCNAKLMSTDMCELALAGLYKKEGYIYDAIKVLEKIPVSYGYKTLVEKLLDDLKM